MADVKFNFEELQVYQKALKFISEVYQLTNTFPKEEIYRLNSQYIRAAVSIALNIAEGTGSSNAQFNRYLQIAQAFIKECVVCSTIARSQNYITPEQDIDVRKNLYEMAKMITNLQKYLKNQNTKEQTKPTKD